MADRVYILLPAHNRRKITINLVEALRLQTYRNFVLVLLDDGSGDGTAEAVTAVLPETVVVRGNGTWWWAGALAAGCDWLEQTGVDESAIVLIMNDDVDIVDTFLGDGVGEFNAYFDTLLLARQMDATTGVELDRGGGVHVDMIRFRFTAAASPEAVNCLPTRGLFIRWRDLRKVGFLPKRLPHYFSDYEFTIRARQLGLRLKVADKVSVKIYPRRTGLTRDDLFAHPRRVRFALLFSNRCKDNPSARAAFVGLAAPPLLRPWLWLRVWTSAAILVVRLVLTPVSRNET